MKLAPVYQMSIKTIPFPVSINRHYFYLSIFGMLVISIFIRTLLLLMDVVPFNSDEAVVALMARHILLGQEMPVFFYGQAYMGSLDAMLIALGFAMFGEKVWVIRFVQITLFCGFLLSTIWFSYLISRSRVIAVLTGLLLTFPSVNVFLYTTVSLGGYGEALLIGNLILVITYFIDQSLHDDRRNYLWFILGCFVGFGFWVFGLTLVFSFASFIYLGIRIFKFRTTLLSRNFIARIGLVIIGVLIGISPIIGYIFQAGIVPIIQEVAGSAIGGSGSGSAVGQIAVRIFSFFVFGIPVIFGIRPPWIIAWLVLPIIPLIIFFWTTALIAFYHQKFNLRQLLGNHWILISLVLIVNITGFLFTPFGSDPSGRYFLPMALPLAIIGAIFIGFMGTKWQKCLWLIPILICAFHVGGIIQSAIVQPPGLTTQIDQIAQVDHRYMPELIEFLEANDIQAGYSNYWVAYPLAFLTQEERIMIPSLPYHLDFRYTSRDNRYSPYNEIVYNSDRIAYITTNHEPLNEYLRVQFISLHASFSETEIGDYHVFYNLPRNIRPNEIGLGVNR